MNAPTYDDHTCTQPSTSPPPTTYMHRDNGCPRCAYILARLDAAAARKEQTR